MKMSEQGRKLLITREGVRLKAYVDSVGVMTIGCGHTSAAGPPHVTAGMTITAAECDDILSRDLVSYERAILDALTVPVEQHEFDALVSICFNVGPKFATSTCMRRLNAGDRDGAASAIMLWNKPPEITGRRQGEQRQFKTPYRTGPAPAPKPQSKAPEAAAGTVVIAGGAAASAAAGDTWGGWGYVGAAVVTILLVVVVITIIQKTRG